MNKYLSHQLDLKGCSRRFIFQNNSKVYTYVRKIITSQQVKPLAEWYIELHKSTCKDNSLLNSSCSISTCFRASPYIDAPFAKILSLIFSTPYLQQSSDNLVPD